MQILNNYYYSEEEKTEVKIFTSNHNKYVIAANGSDSLDYRSEKVTRDVLVYANGGDDTVWGSKNNDTLYGNAGRDELYGYMGNNVNKAA